MSGLTGWKPTPTAVKTGLPETLCEANLLTEGELSEIHEASGCSADGGPYLYGFGRGCSGSGLRYVCILFDAAGCSVGSCGME